MLNLSNPFLCVETFGMTILEAMAYGVPSIAPNIGGPIELIEDGYNGFCVDVTDARSLRKRLRKCWGLIIMSDLRITHWLDLNDFASSSVYQLIDSIVYILSMKKIVVLLSTYNGERFFVCPAG